MQTEVVQGRRSTDHVAVTPTSTTTIHQQDPVDVVWIVLTTAVLSAIVTGIISFIYFQNTMNALRSDYQLQIERQQNQIRTFQLKEDLSTNPVAK